ncbi:MAG: PrgI family protein [Actinocatenispora sp.]
MPADVDAPDKVLYGLTFRQLAILAVAAVVLYGGWQALHSVLPMPVLLGGAVIAAGLAFGLAVGRRDGLPMDVWLLAAVRHHGAPHALSTADTTAQLPEWVEEPEAKQVLPAPLRLPASAVDASGEIALGDTTAAIVATTSVNLALRTGEEQAALVDTFGRWLNSLSSPTQIVVSAQPVDLRSRAHTLETVCDQLPHPALVEACADHARFLHDLAERRDPLRRQVLIVTRAQGGQGGHAARRCADSAVRSLSGLGVTSRALDGPAVTAALAAAADPYRPARPGGLAGPDTVITGPTRAAHRKRDP